MRRRAPATTPKRAMVNSICPVVVSSIPLSRLVQPS
jgi:hypothetical protein